MSGLRPVENEKYEPKFAKHKYVSITSSADQIAASAVAKPATTAVTITPATPAGKKAKDV